MKNNTVGILEDNLALRNSISDYLEATGKYKIIFACSLYAEIATEKIREQPAFLILDIHLPDASAINLISDLQKRWAKTSIIMVTGDKTPELLLEAIEQGAVSFLHKPVIMAELLHVLDQLKTNKSFLQPHMLTLLMELLKINEGKGKKPLNTLTMREKEILTYIEKGKSYKAIASDLNISFHTVNFHLKNIYAKFNVNSKLELITADRNTKKPG